MNRKCELIFKEILKEYPSADLAAIKEKQGGAFRFPIYLNQALNETDLDVLILSTRSLNCLHRAGFTTVGDLVNKINGREDLKRIRNCGKKSVDEIMEQLFCYQYEKLSPEKKKKYITRVLELNRV